MPWELNSDIVKAMQAAENYYNQNQAEPATRLCEDILRQERRHPEALHLLGMIALSAGNIDVAVKQMKAALAVHPAYFEALNSLGMAMISQGRYAKSIEILKKALRINPDYATAHTNLGNAEMEIGNLGTAIKHFQRALKLIPDYAPAHYNLGNALKDMGNIAAALTAYDKAAALAPQYPDAHYGKLLALCHKPNVTRKELLEAHRVIDQLYPARPALPFKNKQEDRNRPLVVGLLGRSKLFGQHPALWLTLPGLERLDESRIQLQGYSHGVPPDTKFTHRLRSRCVSWRDISQMNAADAAALIRSDNVDILISMSGAAESRMDVFAFRPAPVQVIWGGAWGTSGSSSVDWIIADSVEIPPGFEDGYSERVYRMPDGCWVYHWPDDAPVVKELPALRNGYVTFGSFNRSAKINPDILSLWARVLQRVPDSRLFLKGAGFAIKDVVQDITKFFSDRGVSAKRVRLEGPSSHKKVLEDYGQIDIALDPIPYSGGLTTCEAFWMGVPVITLPGETFSSRHAASHLTNVGLADWVTDTPDAYVEKAVWWAEHSQDLAGVRAKLRDRVASSPLCDASRFSKNLEAAFRTMLGDIK